MKYQKIVKAIQPYLFTVISLILAHLNLWASRYSIFVLDEMRRHGNFPIRDVADFLWILHYHPITPIVITLVHVFLGFLVLLSQLFELRQPKYQKLIYRLPIIFTLLNLIALIVFISLAFWI